VAKILAPMPPLIFHRDYFPLRKDDTPPITIHVNAKYPLPIEPFSKGITQYKDMLSKLANLKFMDQDITDTHKFPELDKDQYLCTKTNPDTGKI
jgi:hypothetical protein